MIAFLLQTSGSPLMARQNHMFYFVAIGAVLICFILGVIWFIVQMYQKMIKSEAYQNKQHNIPTNASHIKAVGQLCELTEAEEQILAAVCQKYAIPNIAYNYRNTEIIDAAFKKIFEDMQESETDPKVIEQRRSLLLSIRQKFDTAKANQLIITSSKTISEGTELQYYDSQRKLYTAVIQQNTPEALVCTAFKDCFGTAVQPEQLSKIQVFFQQKGNIAYLMTVRVIRYQTGNTGLEMLLSHSNDLQMLQKRSSKRIPMNQKCLFSAVKVEIINEGKTERLKYIPVGKSYGAKLVDIASGGCQLSCNVNVKTNQYLHLEISLNDSAQPDQMDGLVVNAHTDSATNMRILHIRFVSLSQKTRNRILMTVYDYM
ncbi:MAG TPA: PilZ domain-containing protein [Candidatus Treponema faecavium]|nr:PilZ domain-containing protein [Candidatus Treponema faecavium]